MSKTNEVDARLDRIYSSTGDKRALFDEMAATYDHDLINDLGYVADAVACDKFISLESDRNARILDVGCGTGLVGRRLKAAGYSDIHGTDYSSKMLDEARSTNVYSSLQQQDLTLPIESTEKFDAAIAVGVFGFSGPTAEHFVNITDRLKPGGITLLTVNGKAWVNADWETKLSGFNEAHASVQIIEIETIDYLTAEGIDGRLLTLKTL